MYTEYDDGVAAVSRSECVCPYTAVCIGLTVIGETLAAANRVMKIDIGRIAYIQLEYVDRVVMHLGLHAVGIDT